MRAIKPNCLVCLFFIACLFTIMTAVHPVTAKTIKSSHEVKQECVVLLHGLARTSRSMKKLEAALIESGYQVLNVDYPSRKHKVEKLSAEVIPKAINECRNKTINKIHFVTHSMGGILVRHYLSSHKIKELGRVVMLSPPNQGSEVADKLKNFPGFATLNGPAGQQLGTSEPSIPRQLGPADFDTGIITGNRTINLFLSLLIPGDDDGKVAVERAKLEGMQDFLVMPYSHPFIMKRKAVIQQVLAYLRDGKFNRH